MNMSRAHCYFIALEFVKYARKSLLKEYRLDAPRTCISAGRSFQILGPVIFMENLRVFVRVKSTL